MNIGKLPNSVLKEIIIDRIKNKRNEVLLRPGIGEDCSAVDFEEDICVISSDPITGALNEIGKLAVHVSCNDIASCGAEPVGLMTTILAPPGTLKQQLETIMDQLCNTANSINVDIIGGHTEITDAVNRIIISSTCIGRIKKGKLVSSGGAKPGDKVILTKFAGLEGTSILANDHRSELIKIFNEEIMSMAGNLIDNISVLKEGIIAGKNGANSMHDVTEGGVLGAVWEICEASDTGALIYADQIPILDVTKKICNHYNIDPMKLISSGSMLITTKNDKLIEVLVYNGIKATVIGEITEEKDKYLIINGTKNEILQPETDELFKVI